MRFADPSTARDTIDEALAYLITEDGYFRDDLEAFLEECLDVHYNASEDRWNFSTERASWRPVC